MRTLRVIYGLLSLSVMVFVVSGMPAYADTTENFTATTFTSATRITIPGAVVVSPETGGRSIKNKWSINANIAYSSYSINANTENNINNQTGSIGYLGVSARYGITEDLMLSGEFDYLYGSLSSNISGTTIANSYSGFPVSVNILLFVPMNNFGIYAGIGPVYLASLSLKQKVNGVQGTDSGFGAGAQGMIGMETYLTSNSSLGLELRYRHINLYQNNRKSIAPLDSLSVGLNLIFYL
jgi:opacity protein-like surface antigen